MKLVVFGPTGGIGAQVVEQALVAGHTVTAVARRPSAIALRYEHLEVVKGDVLEPQTICGAIAGKDAIVSAIGVHDRAPTTVYSEGVANILQAMQSAHVRRLICISASGLDPGPLWQRLIAKPILWAVFKEMYSDLVRMESVVEPSPIDWTILRPPSLTNGPRTGRYQVALNKHLRRILFISRADIADFIISHLSEPATYCARVEIAY
jgi:putative NADH-flavin reductase